MAVDTSVADAVPTPKTAQAAAMNSLNEAMALLIWGGFLAQNIGRVKWYLSAVPYQSPIADQRNPDYPKQSHLS
jgi:hypothetical protein